MLLCLDIGNTHIFGGVVSGEDIKLRFRYAANQTCTSDVLGIFFKDVLEHNGFAASNIEAIVISSVVPSLDYSVVSACKKYFKLTPLQLKPGIKTGIKVEVKNPLEVGADRIANAIAAVAAFPDRNILITDFGTATTVCAISKDKSFLGGAILPGFKLSMDALSSKAAQLSAVDLVVPETALGKTTASNLQAGIYYSQLGGVQNIMNRINAEAFADDPALAIATGGYAQLFAEENLFEVQLPDLVLHGLRLLFEKNR